MLQVEKAKLLMPISDFMRNSKLSTYHIRTYWQLYPRLANTYTNLIFIVCSYLLYVLATVQLDNGRIQSFSGTL